MNRMAAADSRRSYRRRPIRIGVFFTPLSAKANIHASPTPPLRLEGTITNLSAGGAEVETPYCLDDSAYFLLHLAVADNPLPGPILCQSIWIEPSGASGTGARCGIKFITSERLSLSSSFERFGDLPAEVFEFDREKQAEFSRCLENWGNN